MIALFHRHFDFALATYLERRVGRKRGPKRTRSRDKEREVHVLADSDR
jgi:hypothetical protein